MNRIISYQPVILVNGIYLDGCAENINVSL